MTALSYLELCRRAARECEITASSSIPASVLNQTGELKRLVDWVSQAYVEIQNKHVAPGWRWLRSTWSVNTVAGTDTYAPTACTDTRLSAPITRFKRWWPMDELGYSNVKAYLLADGVGTERWIPFLPWAHFRALYKIGTQNNGPLAFCTIDPQNNLVFGPKPDGIYVVSSEYQMSAKVLAADADAHEMPSDFESLIVFRAMEKHGQYEGAVEVFNRGNMEGNRLERQLEIDQLPPLAMAAPLA